MHKTLRRLALVAGAVPFLAHADLASQRQLFSEAYRQLEDGKAVDLTELGARLGDYPLTPYLEYTQIRQNLDRAEPARIERFLHQQPDLAVSESLRQSYLEQLGRTGEWKRFEGLYRPTQNAELRCYWLQGKAQTDGIGDGWLASAKALWQTQAPLPRACDGVERTLFERRAVTSEQVWEKVVALMERGETRAADQLRDRLEPAAQRWLARWQQVHRQPATLRRPGFELKGAEAALIAAHGLLRLARSDTEAALSLLDEIETSGLWTPLERARLRRDIVLHAAYSQDPAALPLLDALPDEAVNEEVRLWRARLALRVQDWPRLLTAVAALPASVRNDSQWRYWRGYALDETGQREAARELLGALALQRNYYGFLAADHLGRPYSMEHSPVRFSAEELTAIAADPAIRRAEEFYRLGLMPEARREWQAAVARFDTQQKARAATLAYEWGWYDRAVFTANSAGLDDALKLRFPTPYRQQVEHYSRLHRLDPQVTYAILRKESAFRADAVSPAGAMGLMQVMPETGRSVARGMKEKLPSKYALLEVDTNLKLGSAYLRAMLDRYSGNLVLAAAAYNAGPHRVADWLDRNADLPPAVWIEAISFYETRDYVKAILAFATVFDWQLSGQPRRISDYLLPMYEKTVSCATPAAQEGCGSS